jgi:hypothetical protein
MWRDDNPSRVRSIRRALRTLIDKGFIIELGRSGRRQPFRYCVHPELFESCGKEVSTETRLMLMAQSAYEMQRALSSGFDKIEGD